MPQKSHRVASRQAQVSKERKRKKRASQRRSTVMPVNPVATSEQVSQPLAAKPSAKPSAPRAVLRYRDVTVDLRKTAVITGAILIILIVLSFVL